MAIVTTVLGATYELNGSQNKRFAQCVQRVLNHCDPNQDLTNQILSIVQKSEHKKVPKKDITELQKLQQDELIGLVKLVTTHYQDIVQAFLTRYPERSQININCLMTNLFQFFRDHHHAIEAGTIGRLGPTFEKHPLEELTELACLVPLAKEQRSAKFVFDPTATSHCVWDKSLFQNYQPIMANLRLCNDEITPIVGTGDVHFEFMNRETVLLKDVKHVPACVYNIYSVSTARSCGSKFWFTAGDDDNDDLYASIANRRKNVCDDVIKRDVELGEKYILVGAAKPSR